MIAFFLMLTTSARRAMFEVSSIVSSTSFIISSSSVISGSVRSHSLAMSNVINCPEFFGPLPALIFFSMSSMDLSCLLWRLSILVWSIHSLTETMSSVSWPGFRFGPWSMMIAASPSSVTLGLISSSVMASTVDESMPVTSFSIHFIAF